MFYVVNSAAESRRREALFAAATLRGWTFTQEMPELTTRWDGQPFGQGDNRRARDVLSGAWHDHEFVAFTYSYDTSTTDSKGDRHTTTHRFGVVARALPAWLPDPRGPAREHPAPGGRRRRAGQRHRARVRGLQPCLPRHRDATRSTPPTCSPPRAMEQLLAAPHVPWRIQGDSILTWQGSTLTPEQVEALLTQLDSVISGIPTFVWKDHGYDPSTEGPHV